VGPAAGCTRSDTRPSSTAGRCGHLTRASGRVGTFQSDAGFAAGECRWGCYRFRTEVQERRHRRDGVVRHLNGCLE
jgi:hypothetical protein